MVQKTALDSAQERIKSLEDVLVAIRAKVSSVSNTSVFGGLKDSITQLINETLDPCKPWCCLREGHDGACMQAEDLADGE